MFLLRTRRPVRYREWVGLEVADDSRIRLSRDRGHGLGLVGA